MCPKNGTKQKSICLKPYNGVQKTHFVTLVLKSYMRLPEQEWEINVTISRSWEDVLFSDPNPNTWQWGVCTTQTFYTAAKYFVLSQNYFNSFTIIISFIYLKNHEKNNARYF